MKVFTCFGPGGWELYAKRFVETFLAHWDLPLVVYYHDQELPADVPQGPTYVKLEDAHPGFLHFRKSFPFATGQTPQGYNFRYDALKFSGKVFALGHMAATENEKILWLDADTFTTEKVDAEFLGKVIPPEADIVCLRRVGINYSETSFVLYDLNKLNVKSFVNDILNTYTSGEVFGYAEHHDGFIFERLLNLHILHGMAVWSLTPVDYRGLEAFENSILGTKMKHLKGPRKNPPHLQEGPKGSRPLVITPMDSMPKEHIEGNVRHSLATLKEWLQVCERHGGKLLVAAGGPSLREACKEIRERQENGDFLMAVKHAVPVLTSEGIVPDGLVVLDPRPVQEVSTHGVRRAELFDCIDPRTKVFLASMTDKGSVDYILSKTSNVVGWHAFTGHLRDSGVLPNNTLLINGGTCSALRAIGLGETLGFAEFHFYGLDLCLDPASLTEENRKEVNEKGLPKYLEVDIGRKDHKRFVSTGELLAAAQDANVMFTSARQLGFKIYCYGEGIGRKIWLDILGDVNQNKKDFNELYGRNSSWNLKAPIL